MVLSNYWKNLITAIERLLIRLFRKWGFFVARHPLITILISLSFALSLGAFIFDISTETSLMDLYVPKNSVSYKNYVSYVNRFGPFDTKLFDNEIIITSSKKHENIFTLKHLLALQEMHAEIMELTAEIKNESYTYKDLCYQHQNGNCEIKSILEFYDFNKTMINNTFKNKLIVYPIQYSIYSGSNEYTSSRMGGIELNEDKKVELSNDLIRNHDSIDVQIITSAQAFSINYKTSALKQRRQHLKWVNRFLEFVASYENDLFDISYRTKTSLKDELLRAIASDAVSLLIAFLLLFFFSGLALLRFKSFKKCKIDYTRSRAILSFVGILSAVLSTISSFGLVGGIFGITFNPIVSVAPFLLVGLGVDDMFVLLRSYELTDCTLSVPERIALTMERGGISIMFTSLTDLVAFCVGYTSTFGSISSFCVYCGVGIFFDFLFTISFFLGFMVYDSRLAQVKIKTQSKTELESQTVSCNISYIINILLSSFYTKIIIIFCFFLCLFGASFGVMSLHADQDVITLAPHDSYLLDYYELNNKYFSDLGMQMQFIFDKPLDYSDIGVQLLIDKFTHSVRNDSCFKQKKIFQTSWIRSYTQYLSQHYFYFDDFNKNLTNSSELFYDILFHEYLFTLDGEQYINDIWDILVAGLLNNSNSTVQLAAHADKNMINSSRIWMHLEISGTKTSEITKCLSHFKSLTASDNEYNELGVYYYLYPTAFAEADLYTVKETIFNLIYALCAVCLFTLILIPYPSMSILTMTTVAQILYCSVGYASLWGLPINITSMINIIMAIGFSVDNSAHICHAFINAPRNVGNNCKDKKTERKNRVLFAVNSAALPVLAGDISTVLALLPLSTAKSDIFITFWKCLSLVMLFGTVYAVIYLPIILSIFGPIQTQYLEQKEIQKRKYNKPNRFSRIIKLIIL